jgi:uncharacterized membrane protein YcaP (DUF421 family)
MDKEDIIPWDWQRILIGEVPAGFLIEVILRVGFIYFLVIISMRILGKKMASQLTRNEMAALVCLAAAVGVPILAPDRGLLPALIICIVIVSLSRLVIHFSVRNEKIEPVALGVFEKLVDNGVMAIKKMETTGITKERMFAQLRSEEIFHLGQVSKLFFEANGQFTLIKAKEPMPGLSVIPEEDHEFLKELARTDNLVCNVCGHLSHEANTQSPCPSCGHRDWVYGVSVEVKIPEEVN